MNAPGSSFSVAFAVGDTAGHASTASAIAAAIRDRHPDANVLFLGTAGSHAARALAREHARFVAVPGGPLRRAAPHTIAMSVVRTVDGARVARAILKGARTGLAFGVGGFATGGVLVAARTLGLATAVHEANVEPGLANRLLAPIVDRVYVGTGSSRLRGVETGTPIRSEIACVARRRRHQPPTGRLRVLVTTGSRGAAFLAEHLPPLLGDVRQRGVAVEVMQQTADVDGARLVEQYAAMGIPARTASTLDIAEAYEWADVAIARAGANTIAELSTMRVPAVLVPLADASGNHQEANARRWAAAGAGIVSLERERLRDGVRDWLEALATHERRWSDASAAAHAMSRPDAAQRIADDCEDLMRRRGR